MCFFKIIIFLLARTNRSHQHKTSGSNNSSDSDAGAITHPNRYRTAKFICNIFAYKFGCFCFLLFGYCCRSPPFLLCKFNEIYAKGEIYEIIF